MTDSNYETVDGLFPAVIVSQRRQAFRGKGEGRLKEIYKAKFIFI